MEMESQGQGASILRAGLRRASAATSRGAGIDGGPSADVPRMGRRTTRGRFRYNGADDRMGGRRMNSYPEIGTSRDIPAEMISVDEALEYLLAKARPVTETEWAGLEAAQGRVLARAECSEIDVPGYDNSAMDGFAVRSADCRAAGPVALSVRQRIAAGELGVLLEAGSAARIFTGAALPPGADAVVMQEDCRVEGEKVFLKGPIASGHNVRPRGNNIAANAEVLPAGVRIRALEMGMAAAVGRQGLTVFRRLRVAIFSSGNELVEPGEPLTEGKIFNSNRYSLLGLLRGLGCEVEDRGIVKDDAASTESLLVEAAAKADVVVGSGGMSVGEEDHVRRALKNVGEVQMWRVAVKPGKPIAYGRIGECDFFGLPGNPVSTVLSFLLFVRPFLLRRQGLRNVLPTLFPVVAGFAWPTPGRRREFVRARLERARDGKLRARIHPKQGSDVLASTVWADGLVQIPEHGTVAEGDEVAYLSFSELD